MKTIYIVTSGSYSDYSIEEVFDNKELAQKYIDNYLRSSYDEPEIEEHTLNPLVRELSTNKKAYALTIDKEGNTEFKSSSFFNSQESVCFRDWDNKLLISCWANDEQHAIKIANEKRLQLLAANQWGVTSKIPS